MGRVVNGQIDPLLAFGGPQVQDNGIGRFNGVSFVGEVVPKQATIVARRRTQALFGLGLADAVPDSVLVALASHQAAATPATAGRVALVPDPVNGGMRAGKFGWKAQQPDLAAFAADAPANELGVTNPLNPDENCPQGDCTLLRANPARSQPNDPTIRTISRLADFTAMLVPAPTGPVGPDERAGAAIFATIGCAGCHQPTLQAGPSPIGALSHANLAPDSDFLLHEMGALGDGIAQGAAGPREMRTAPLWGLRFQHTLLHDGHAAGPADAILAHDGQGRPARDRFAALTAAQRGQLIAFLNAL